MSLSGDVLKKIDPIEYFDRFLSEGLYPDGRDIGESRPIKIEIGIDPHSRGSSYVHQDGANVLCSARLSIAPVSDDPIIQLEIDALESIPKELIEDAKLTLSSLLDKHVILDPDVLRLVVFSKPKGTTLSTLAPATYELQWTIHANITVFSVDGFLIGGILLALETAIMNIALPEVEYEGQGILEDDFITGEDVHLPFDLEKLKFTEQPAKKEKIRLKELLVYMPFVLYKPMKAPLEDYTLLCDPTMEIRNLFNNYAECIIGSDCQFHVLNISATENIEGEIFDEISGAVKRRHKNISNILKKKLYLL